MEPSDTDTLLNYLKQLPDLEVDHAFVIYLEPKRKMPWRETKAIREAGYKIQDIYNDDVQTKITLVKDD